MGKYLAQANPEGLQAFQPRFNNLRNMCVCPQVLILALLAASTHGEVHSNTGCDASCTEDHTLLLRLTGGITPGDSLSDYDLSAADAFPDVNIELPDLSVQAQYTAGIVDRLLMERRIGWRQNSIQQIYENNANHAFQPKERSALLFRCEDDC